MHILATGTEEQAVYSGHLIHPSYSILPPSHKKLKRGRNEAKIKRKRGGRLKTLGEIL
jgi:hypothetical protein